MIVTEFYKTRADGVKLVRTYSDSGFRLIRDDGSVYDEAIDIENSGYTYTESDELVENVVVEEPEVEEPVVDEEVSAEEALAELLEVLEA